MATCNLLMGGHLQVGKVRGEQAPSNLKDLASLLVDLTAKDFAYGLLTLVVPLAAVGRAELRTGSLVESQAALCALAVAACLWSASPWPLAVEQSIGAAILARVIHGWIMIPRAGGYARNLWYPK